MFFDFKTATLTLTHPILNPNEIAYSEVDYNDSKLWKLSSQFHPFVSSLLSIAKDSSASSVERRDKIVSLKALFKQWFLDVTPTFVFQPEEEGSLLKNFLIESLFKEIASESDLNFQYTELKKSFETKQLWHLKSDLMRINSTLLEHRSLALKEFFSDDLRNESVFRRTYAFLEEVNQWMPVLPELLYFFRAQAEVESIKTKVDLFIHSQGM
jgi:hypothetical protein